MTEAQDIHLLLENRNGDMNMHLLGKLPGEGETTRDPKLWIAQAQGGLQLCGCWVPGRVGNPQSRSCHRFSPPLELMFLEERRMWALSTHSMRGVGEGVDGECVVSLTTLAEKGLAGYPPAPCQ